eukprot:GHVS01094663.1.p1 GENE.GHVS01094663.1~~GHVS01094663.1.p1  ORF type:complete len:620 (-),score=173.88 GHVS01094663.1:295-2154(-)
MCVCVIIWWCGSVYFKTKLCVNWGKHCCRRGMSCRMAHGMEELRYRTSSSSTPQNHNSYSHLSSTDGNTNTNAESKTTTHARASLMKWTKAHTKRGTTAQQQKQQPQEEPPQQQEPLQQQQKRQAPQQSQRHVSSGDVAFVGDSNDAITGASPSTHEQGVRCCTAIVEQHNNNKSIANNNNIPLVDKQDRTEDTQLDDEKEAGILNCCGSAVGLHIGHQQNRHGRRRSSQATTCASSSSSGLPDDAVVVEETVDIDEQSSVDDMMLVTSDAECLGSQDNTTLAATILTEGDKLDLFSYDGCSGGWTNRTTMVLEEGCDNYKRYDERGGCQVCRLSPPDVVLGDHKQQEERTTRWNMLISAMEEEDRYCNDQGMLNDNRRQPLKDFLFKQPSTTTVEQPQSSPPATTTHYNNSSYNYNEQLSYDYLSESSEHNISETFKEQQQLHDNTPSYSIDDDSLLSADPVCCSSPLHHSTDTFATTTTALNDQKISTTTNTLLMSKTPTTTTIALDVQQHPITSPSQHICTHNGGDSSSCCFAPFCFECYRRGKGGYGIGYYAAVGCLVRQNGRQPTVEGEQQQQLETTTVCQSCGLPEWLSSCLASQHSGLGCAPLHKLPEAYED